MSQFRGQGVSLTGQALHGAGLTVSPYSWISPRTLARAATHEIAVTDSAMRSYRRSQRGGGHPHGCRRRRGRSVLEGSEHPRRRVLILPRDGSCTHHSREHLFVGSTPDSRPGGCFSHDSGRRPLKGFL
jgi:hypothetical protein